MKCFCCLLVVILLTDYALCKWYKQEGAKVNFYDPEYVADCYAITRRLGRGEPYRSNFTCNQLDVWGNNITVKVSLFQKGVGEVVIMKYKLCEALEVEWIKEFCKNYSVRKNMLCPVTSGLVGFHNVEFPPKNLPASLTQLVNNKVLVKFYILLTRTEKYILETIVTLSP